MLSRRSPRTTATTETAKTAVAILKETQVVDEGGFATTAYFTLVRGEMASVYDLVGTGCVDGVEVELLDRDSAGGVPWRRWLRVTAPIGTAFVKRIWTPNREGARVDRESVPHRIEEFGLRLSRSGNLVPAHVVAEEVRRKAALRQERSASPDDVRRALADVASALGPKR